MSRAAERAQHDGAAAYKGGLPASANPHRDFDLGAMWAWGWHAAAGVQSPGLRLQMKLALGPAPRLMPVEAGRPGQGAP